MTPALIAVTPRSWRPATALQPGTWVAGPDFPVLSTGRTTGAKDAPAALLPNGRVLCAVGPYDPTNANSWGSPVEYDPGANTLTHGGNTLTQVPSPSNNGGSPFSSRMILLPTGQVLHTNGSSTVAIYTPDGSPDPVWRPSITSVPAALHPGGTYTLHGRQISGQSQAMIARGRGFDGELPYRSADRRCGRRHHLLPYARPLHHGRVDRCRRPHDAVHRPDRSAARCCSGACHRQRDRLRADGRLAWIHRRSTLVIGVRDTEAP